MVKVDTQNLILLANLLAVGAVQSIGNIEESRNVTEYEDMTSNETIKALGSIKRGSVALSVLYDPDDAAGQAELRTAFENNTAIPFSLELPNSLGVNGTTFSWTGNVSKITKGIPKDGAVLFDVTIEISSAVTTTAASAV